MKTLAPIFILLVYAFALIPHLAQSSESSPVAQAAELKELKIHYAILHAEKKQLIGERQELEKKLEDLQNRLANENEALKHQLKLQSAEKVDLILQMDKLYKELRQTKKENEEQDRNKEKLLREAGAEKMTLVRQVEKLTAENNDLLLQRNSLADELKIVQNKPTLPRTALKRPPESEKNLLDTHKVREGKSVVPEAEQIVTSIARTVNRWSKAWSEQNVDEYLAFYSPDFQPPTLRSRTVWEQQRRLRLKRPKFINVSLQDIKIDVVAPSNSRVQFIQSFKSDTYADTVAKQLVMRKENSGWQILSEREL